MRNDVNFPPAAGDAEPTRTPTTAPATTPATPARSAAVGGKGHPDPHPHAHRPDRAHSLERTSDHAATDVIYDMPEARGGIDSLTLTIIVVSVVCILLLIVAYTVFSS